MENESGTPVHYAMKQIKAVAHMVLVGFHNHPQKGITDPTRGSGITTILIPGFDQVTLLVALYPRKESGTLFPAKDLDLGPFK